MSLINDALRKAQRQRSGEAPPLASMPSVGGESPARIAKRAKPAGFNALLLRFGLGAGALLVVVGIGAYFAFRSTRAETAVSPPQTQPVSPAIKRPDEPAAGQTKSGEPSAALRPPSTEPAPTFTLPIAVPATVPQPAPVTRKPAEPVIVATPPATTPATVAAKPIPTSAPAAKQPDQTAAAPTAAVAKMDGKSVAYIENLRIAGIRASATDAKVLMNDRVYRVGDIVEHELGLKLVGITSSSMTFEDEQGARYTRSF